MKLVDSDWDIIRMECEKLANDRRYLKSTYKYVKMYRVEEPKHIVRVDLPIEALK